MSVAEIAFTLGMAFGTVFGFLLGAVLVPEKIGEQDDEG